MNTIGIITMLASHSMQVHCQTMQLMGAYREHLPRDAATRTHLMVACNALGNIRLAHATDAAEWEADRPARNAKRTMAQLVMDIEEAAIALRTMTRPPKRWEAECGVTGVEYRVALVGKPEPRR